MIGRTLGNYRIVEQIGAGGMASVYKAYDPNTDRYVALKILPEHYGKDSEFYERFRREAKSIANLEHIHILPVHAFGEDEGTAYLVMRYLPTGTLSEYIRKNKLSFDEISRILGQVADALDYAHQQGILHRDVKSSNVLLDKNNNAYLTDFGIAGMVEGSSGLTGSNVLGTPQYMSPEQCQGARNLTPASDQYSLGVVLYEMVTGRVPFRAETPLAVIYMHLNAPLPLPHTVRPDLPPPAEQVILKALAKEPTDRYPSCRAMADAFIQAIHAPVPEGEWYSDVPVVDTTAKTTQVRPLPETRDSEGTATNIRPMGSAAAAAPPAAPRRSVSIWILGAVIAFLLIVVLVVAQLSNTSALNAANTQTQSSVLAFEAAMASTQAAVAVTEAVTAANTEEAVLVAADTQEAVVVATDTEAATATTAATETPTDTEQPATATNEPAATNTNEPAPTPADEATAQAVANAGDDPLLQAAAAAEQSGDFSSAINSYTQYLEDDPDNPDVLMQLADAYIANDNYQGAIEPLEDLTALTPDSAPAFKRLGDAQDGAGDRDAAIESYTHALSLDTSYYDAQIARGVAYMNQGDYPSSIADLSAVIEADATSANAFLQRGNTYWAMSDYQHAVDDFAQVIELTDGAQEGEDNYNLLLRAHLNRGIMLSIWWDHEDESLPDLTAAVEMSGEGSTEALIARGGAYITLKQYENAVSDFTAALEQAPSARAYIGRGEAYMGLESLDSALDDFTSAIQVDRGYVSAYVDRGDVYLAQGETERAISDYTSAIGISPDYASAAYTRRSVAHIVRQNYSDAIEDLNHALDLEPTNTIALMLRGYLNKETGDYSAALNDYNAALENGGDSFEALLGRGDVYQSQGDLDSALADLNRALQLEPSISDLYLRGIAPTMANGYFVRADIYASQGNLEAAINDFSQAIELNPQYYDAYVRRGQQYVQLDDSDSALRDFSAAIEIDPDYFWALEQRTDLYASMGRWDEAIEDITHVIETTSWETVYGYGRRGQIRIAQGDVQGGITDLSIAIATDPETAWPYFSRAGAYAQLGDTDHAFEDYSRVIELDPTNYDAYTSRGALYHQTGDYEKAIDDYSAAVEIDSDNPVAYIGRGAALTELGRYDESMEDLNRAIEMSGSGAAYEARGWAYFGQENYVQAIADFTAALQEDDVDALSSYKGLGYAYSALGMRADALRALNRYMDLAGENAEQEVIDKLDELENGRATEEATEQAG